MSLLQKGRDNVHERAPRHFSDRVFDHLVERLVAGNLYNNIEGPIWNFLASQGWEKSMAHLFKAGE